MRINQISPAEYYTRARVHNLKTITNPNQNVNFQSWQGSLGAAVGTGVGAGLGILTGGIATILLAAIAGCGLGGIIGNDSADEQCEEYIDVPYSHE